MKGWSALLLVYLVISGNNRISGYFWKVSKCVSFSASYSYSVAGSDKKHFIIKGLGKIIYTLKGKRVWKSEPPVVYKLLSVFCFLYSGISV